MLIQRLASISNVDTSPSAASSTEEHCVHILRRLACEYMRRNPEEFLPYLSVDGEDDGGGMRQALLQDDPHDSDTRLEQYCQKMESVKSPVWGGQLEIKAMAAVLNRDIWVYDVMSPVLKMDGRSVEGEKPLRIAFHRHFYALGEHYNSTALLHDHSI